MTRENAHTAEGDSIRGEIIVCEAKNISKPRIISNSSTHRAQRTAIDTGAYCIITKSERWINP